MKSSPFHIKRESERERKKRKEKVGNFKHFSRSGTCTNNGVTNLLNSQDKLGLGRRDLCSHEISQFVIEVK